MALILRYFTKFGIFRLEVYCVKVVEDVIVKKFTFAISSPGEFLVLSFSKTEPAHRERNTVQLLQCKTLNFISSELWPHTKNLNLLDYKI